MHNIMRFIRQNKKQIIKVALIVAFLFGFLQLLNYIVGRDSSEKTSNKETSEIYNETKGKVVSDKSAISGAKVSTSEIKKVSEIIEKFVENCNNHNTEEAYNMISDDCKEEIYPNLEDFETGYFENLFGNEKRTYSIEKLLENTYIVKFTGDLLATGRSGSDYSYQDYITVVEENGENKLNINKYIGKEEINKKSSSNDIETRVLYRKKYMDYEIYTMKIKNNTDGNILLDQLIDTDKIYLKDNNDTKHIAYSNEIVKDDLVIYQGHTNEIEIKFDNPYVSGRTIKSICFSEVVLNYNPNNKGGLNLIKLLVNV